MKDILEIKMQRNDAKAKTVRDYLKKLLLRVWIEDEGFSGKRPFGNSGWKSEIELALVKAKAIDGKVDRDGYLESSDSDKADELIQEAIMRMN